jgi:hypothetical protein
MPSDPRPLLIITMGPTGSGKSSLAQATMNQLDIDINIDRMQSFLIDDYVETDIKYRELVELIIKKAGGIEALRNPTENVVADFRAAYFTTRTSEGCKQGKRVSRKPVCSAASKFMDNDADGCDIVFNYDLFTAICDHRDIVFETTGEYYPNWLVEATEGIYDVVVVYSVVTLVELLKRNKSRAFKQAQTLERTGWWGGGAGRAPRLPYGNSSDEFTKTVEKIYDTMFNVIKQNCWEAKNDFCGDLPIKHMLIFDNNTRPMRLMVDLTKDDTSTRQSRDALRKAIRKQIKDSSEGQQPGRALH